MIFGANFSSLASGFSKSLLLQMEEKPLIAVETAHRKQPTRGLPVELVEERIDITHIHTGPLLVERLDLGLVTLSDPIPKFPARTTYVLAVLLQVRQEHSLVHRHRLHAALIVLILLLHIRRRRQLLCRYISHAGLALQATAREVSMSACTVGAKRCGPATTACCSPAGTLF